jgi:hypothetical protein
VAAVVVAVMLLKAEQVVLVSLSLHTNPKQNSKKTEGILGFPLYIPTI